MEKKSLKNIKYWQRIGGFMFWPEIKITRLIDIFTTETEKQIKLAKVKIRFDI